MIIAVFCDSTLFSGVFAGRHAGSPEEFRSF